MNQHEQIETYIEAHDAGKLSALLDTLKYDEVLEVIEKLRNDDDKVAVFEALDEYIELKCFKVETERPDS